MEFICFAYSKPPFCFLFSIPKSEIITNFSLVRVESLIRLNLFPLEQILVCVFILTSSPLFQEKLIASSHKDSEMKVFLIFEINENVSSRRCKKYRRFFKVHKNIFVLSSLQTSKFFQCKWHNSLIKIFLV